MRKICILIIALVLFTFLNLYQTISITSSPTIELFLTKSSYLPDESLEGNILLTIPDKLDASSSITLKLGSQTASLPITEILDSLNYDYDIISSETKISSPETTKTLEFSASGVKELAFSVPKDAEIESLDFDLEGVVYDNSLPSSPSIDLTLDDSIDWTYEGDFLEWSSPILSDNLDLSEASSSIYIESPKFYCNLIDLPLSDKFNISVKYTKEAGADLLATILRFTDKASFIEPNLFCNLPSSPSSEWSSCILNLDTPIVDEYLVCIYTTAPAGTKYFKLTIDSESPFSGYQCDFETTLQGSGTCTSSSDFFIKVQKPLYKRELTSATFEENSILSPTEVADYLTNYIITCTSDNCPIPFSISSTSAGKIILKNLNLDYSTSSGSFSAAKFYNMDTLGKSLISELNGEDIEDQSIQIPLSLFNLKAPSISGESDSIEVKAVSASSTDSQLIDVYKYGIPASSSLEKARNILNNFAAASEDTLSILKALGIDPATELTSLDDYELQLSQIESSNLTSTEKTQQKTSLNAEIFDYLNNLPTYILIKGKVKQQHISTLEDFTDNILDADKRDAAVKAEIYNLQSKANIQSTSIAFWLTNYAGEQEEKTLILKTILNPLGNIYIIEKIPKSIAASADNIIISGDYLVVEQDPILKFRGSATTEYISYLVPGNILDKVLDTVTLLIPTQELPSTLEFACGDEVCTETLEDSLTCPQDCAKKMPWLFLGILLAILIAGVWYINFYRGEWSLKKLIEKRKEMPKLKISKNLFSTEADKINLKNYILKSMQKNIAKSQINRLLLKQGWSQEQIDFIYYELKR